MTKKLDNCTTGVILIIKLQVFQNNIFDCFGLIIQNKHVCFAKFLKIRIPF